MEVEAAGINFIDTYQRSGLYQIPLPATLGPKGSLFLTRPTLFDYLADREALEWRSGDVFNWIETGKLKLRVEHFYALAEVREAHRALEGRKTTGKVILTP